HRPLVAAELALDRARHVDAAQLLDGVVGDAVLEHVAPAVGKGPEYRRHMRPDGLALRPRRALACAPVELRQHGGVGHGGGIDVADARLGHRRVPSRLSRIGAQAAERGRRQCAGLAAMDQRSRPAMVNQPHGCEPLRAVFLRAASLSRQLAAYRRWSAPPPANPLPPIAVPETLSKMPFPRASKALSRFTVLDLPRVRAGPTGVRQLADWGANVIKIELPPDPGG